MVKKLTVAITTYNRKEPLLEQLRSLEIQGMYDKYNIIVSDNCSDYDVDKWLDENLTKEFREIVTIHHNKYNIGGDCNIAQTFFLTETQWMWLLSDDDITEPVSLSVVFSDIEQNADVCAMKYSISGKFNRYEDKRVNNLYDFLKIHDGTKHSAGELVFMSNNVYNLEMLKPYIGKAPQYTHTYYSQLIPQMYAMKAEHLPVLFSSRCLTNYVLGRASYKAIYAYMSFSNLIYSNMELDNKEVQLIRSMWCSTRAFVSMLVQILDKNEKSRFFKKLRCDYYNPFSLSWFMFTILYNISSVVGYKNMKMLARLLKRKK